MIEFESFCFLQNHKTGCTLVETFLRAHCSEDIVRYEKHWAPPARRPGKFHFVGVREPLDTYLSLFNYGLDGRGEIFLRLNAAGLGALYAAGIDGFAEWLRHILDPAGRRHCIRPVVRGWHRNADCSPPASCASRYRARSVDPAATGLPGSPGRTRSTRCFGMKP